MKKEKTALIVSGGGMRCSYSAGAMYALAKKYKTKNFDIIMGGSGSTGILSYSISGQLNMLRNIFFDLLCSKNVVDDLRLKKIIDIDYIIDEIFKKQAKLNEKLIASSKTLYLIASTNYKTGKVEYFSDFKKLNIFEAMRASMAMPVAFNRVIKFNGAEYCDSPNSSHVELHILKAIELGATKILFIDNLESEYLDEIGFDIWLALRSKKFIKNYLSERKKRKNMVVPNNVDIFHLKPKLKLRIGLLQNDKELLQKTFNQGYSETLEDKDLMKFLKSKV